MPLIRCPHHHPKSLEEFYSEKLQGGEVDAAIGVAMLEIILRINDIFKESTIYGSTSLYQLKLLSDDCDKSPWYVSIISSGPETSWIEYLLPEHRQPWPGTWVRGEVHSYDELIKCIIIAMTECGGWPDNEELKRVYASLVK